MLAVAKEENTNPETKSIEQLQKEIREYLRTQNNGEELMKLEYAFEASPPTKVIKLDNPESRRRFIPCG